MRKQISLSLSLSLYLCSFVWFAWLGSLQFVSLPRIHMKSIFPEWEIKRTGSRTWTWWHRLSLSLPSVWIRAGLLAGWYVLSVPPSSSSSSLYTQRRHIKTALFAGLRIFRTKKWEGYKLFKSYHSWEKQQFIFRSPASSGPPTQQCQTLDIQITAKMISWLET